MLLSISLIKYTLAYKTKLKRCWKYCGQIFNYNYLFQWTNKGTYSYFIPKVGLIRNVPMGFSPQLLDSITPAFPRRNLVGMKRLAGKKSEPYQHRVESYLKEFKTWVKLRNNKNALNPKSTVPVFQIPSTVFP